LGLDLLVSGIPIRHPENVIDFGREAKSGGSFSTRRL
jgi:hypothetical protein